MITIFLETKQHEPIKHTLSFDSAETTQHRLGKEAYQLLLHALRDIPHGSTMTLAIKESADKETKLVVHNQTHTEGGHQVTPVPPDEPLMARIYDYMAKNIEKEDLTIDDLTQACAMSRSQLFRKLKALTAKTPAQLIRDYRLDTAYRLFQTDKTKRVSEVMYAVGFNDAKHFGQIFKQRFGVSPQVMKR